MGSSSPPGWSSPGGDRVRVRLAALGAAGPAHRPGLTVRLEDDAGHLGVGDAAPLPGRTADDLAGARAALGAVGAAGAFEVAPSVGGVVEALAALAAGGLDPARVPSATFALETALLDLVGRRLGQPVWALLRDPPRPGAGGGQRPGPGPRLGPGRGGRRPGRGLPGPEGEVRRGALAAVRAGLAAARTAGGAALALRLDVGGAWPVADAPGHLAALSDLGLAYVEDPVAAGDLSALARALSAPGVSPDAAAVPLAADALLEPPGGLDAVLAAGIFSVAILKPAFLGGLLAARALARRARAAGLAVVVTHALDGPAGLAAAADLALALDAAAPGLGPLVPTRASWTGPATGPVRVRGPAVIPGDAPGLGLGPEAP